MRARALGLDLGDALADDLLAALGGQHVGVLEDLLVGGGLCNHVLARSEDAVAARGVAAPDVGILHGHDLAAEQRADPANGAHEGLVLRAPALRAVVGPLDGGDHVVAELRQDGHGGGGGHVLLGKDVLVAIGVNTTLKLGGIDAELAREALGGLGRVALGVEGDLGLGPAHDLMHRLGLGRHVGDDDSQTAGRGDDSNATMGEAGRVERLLDELGKLLGRIDERSGGHLLAPDLEQEILRLCHLGHLALRGIRVLLAGDLREVALAAGLGNGADAQDVVGSLRGRDRAAGVEDVERVAALHDAVIGRKRKLALETGVALCLVLVELATHHVDVGNLEVVRGELHLVLMEDVAVGHGSAVGQVGPHEVVDRVDALRVHGDALEAVRRSPPGRDRPRCRQPAGSTCTA